MNEELILKMAAPSIKNGVLTYALFDKIYSMLSLREQYQVCEILHKNSIELLDSGDHEGNDSVTPTLSESELFVEPSSDAETPLYDTNIFKDTPNSTEYLYFETDIKQSNDTLIKLIQEGSRQARQDLCVKNRNLVLKYANAYYHLMGNDLDLEDLEQAGFIGLLTAAERFDFSRDSAFSTYAVIWIKQAISRQVADIGYRVRVPVHMMDKIRTAIQLDKKYDALGFDYNHRIKCIAREMAMPENMIEELFVIKQTFLGSVSIDTPVGEEEETPLSEFLPSDIENDVEGQIFRAALVSELDSVLKTLKPREEKVIRARFGLDDGHPRTLEDLGREFCLTRERIRQIEEKALRKLRHPSRLNKIKDYYIE